MPRFRMTIEYDGSAYVGWQRQENGPSVQGAVEKAILSLTGETVSIRGAGRTDSGVHAKGQVAHADLTRSWKPATLRNALNAHLGQACEQVVIIDAAEVTSEFDARFSALRRHYLYRIVSRPAPLALEAKRAWWVPKTLDHEAMHAAAQMLVGHHDFTTFRSTHCQANSPMRTIDRLDVTRDNDLVEIRATAQSFLHNQIRSFAGTLKLVGECKWTPDDVRAALEAKDRKACGPVAPPDGLYFMQVDYPRKAFAEHERGQDQQGGKRRGEQRLVFGDGFHQPENCGEIRQQKDQRQQACQALAVRNDQPDRKRDSHRVDDGHGQPVAGDDDRCKQFAVTERFCQGGDEHQRHDPHCHVDEQQLEDEDQPRLGTLRHICQIVEAPGGPADSHRRQAPEERGEGTPDAKRSNVEPVESAPVAKNQQPDSLDVIADLLNLRHDQTSG
jgi:tRNA pseudouridine38-40 synthase